MDVEFVSLVGGKMVYRYVCEKCGLSISTDVEIDPDKQVPVKYDCKSFLIKSIMEV